MTMNIDMIKNAKKSMEGVVKKTPLMKSNVFSQETRNQVYIKPENLQLTGSFKIRGAYNKIINLPKEQQKRGFVASSAGNHAQGVAYSAQQLGVKATIVMPIQTPLIKVEATRSYGADVVLHGDCYDDAYHKALEIAEEEGKIFIHPFDDEMVIAGQGTIGLEILEDMEDVDYVLVPIGGGGLASGVATAIKAIKPSVIVMGVEPEGAKTMSHSFENNRIETLEEIRTIAEGVAVKRPGDNCYELCREHLDGIVTVSDVEILEAFLLLLEREKLVAENAGVLSLAAIKKLHCNNKKVVALVSGGNIDVVTISEMINRGLISRGRLFCFSVELHDTPGELQKISTLLSELNANIIQLDHNQFKTIDRFNHVQLEITVETNGHAHVKEIKNVLEGHDYVLNVVY